MQTPQSQASTKQAPPSWASDLQAYLASTPALDAASAARRSSLLKTLQADSCSAEAWWAFLQHEEGLAAAAASPPKGLGALFGWATRTVPRQGKASSEAYQLLWIGLARQQWWVHHSASWCEKAVCRTQRGLCLQGEQPRGGSGHVQADQGPAHCRPVCTLVWRVGKAGGRCW